MHIGYSTFDAVKSTSGEVMNWVGKIGRRNIGYAAFIAVLFPSAFYLEESGPSGPDAGGGVMFGLIVWALVSVVFFLWNLVLLIRIKLQAIAAHIAKIDVGAKGTLVAFHNDSFPDPAGLIAYATRLAGTVKLRPDNRLAVTRAWGDPQARLNGLLQLTKGLAGIVVKAKR